MSALGHSGAEEEAQHAAHLVVESLHGIFAFLDTLEIGESQIVVVVGVVGASIESVGACTEFHVETIVHGLVGVVASSPVGDDDAVVAPLAFYKVAQQILVVAVVLIAVEVVGSHKAPDVSLSDGSMEGRQIDFMECALGDDDIGVVAVLLVVVEAEVLYACRHMVFLHALNIGHHHCGAEVGVLTEILEVAPVERCAVDVHAGT